MDRKTLIKYNKLAKLINYDKFMSENIFYRKYMFFNYDDYVLNKLTNTLVRIYIIPNGIYLSDIVKDMIKSRTKANIIIAAEIIYLENKHLWKKK